MTKLRLIGDCHGKFSHYHRIIKGVEHSIQLGDMGFDYTPLQGINQNHKFLNGNHDNIDKLPKVPHWLGKYGELNGGMFFVSGGFSIDREIRIKMNKAGAWGQTYWENEELSVRELYAAIDQYCQVCPEIMLTHEAPRSIIKQFTNGSILTRFGFDPETFSTRTSEALQVMFDHCLPKKWYFGHYHTSWTKEIYGCEFTCLNELEYTDIEIDL
jgi:hypothetical protein